MVNVKIIVDGETRIDQDVVSLILRNHMPEHWDEPNCMGRRVRLQVGARMSNEPRVPPQPIQWELETIRDIPPFAQITWGVVAICLGILAIAMLLTGLI